MNPKACSGFERMARQAEYRGKESLGLSQLEGFPLRVSFVKRGLLFAPKISHTNFDKLARDYLEIVADATLNEGRYALVLNRAFFEDMPIERFFAFDCKSHKPFNSTDMISLDELTKETFDESREIQIDIRIPSNENCTSLDYFDKPKNMLFVYAQGSLDFKEQLAQRIIIMKLPSRFKLGKTGYEFI